MPTASAFRSSAGLLGVLLAGAACLLTTAVVGAPDAAAEDLVRAPRVASRGVVSRAPATVTRTPARAGARPAAARATGRRRVVSQPARTALQLAATKGLSYSDHRTYVLLEGATLRLRMYPGTNVAVVAGKEYQLKDRIVRTRDDVYLSSRVTRFLTGRIDQFRIDERRRKQALLGGTRKHEPLPPLPERKVIARKVPKVDFTATARPAPRPKARPAPVAAQAGWVPHASERDWKWIVLHHSDDESGNMEKYDRYHRDEKGWENGCGYHFVVGNGTLSADGEIEIGPRWPRQLQGAHAKVPGNRYNERGIGICLVGDFDIGAQGPSSGQMDGLVDLVRWLKARYGIEDADIMGHCDCCSTCCPGRNFPWAEFRRRIAD